MKKVFVHGNPETNVIWSALFDALKGKGVEDIVALSPPGFGAPVPEGFKATPMEYRDWLIQQLEQLGGNVDLVGHDWGALHVYAVLDERPDLVRSWAADGVGTLHADYTWHDLGQVWQTSGAGEESISTMFGLPEDQAVEVLTAFGIGPDIAAKMAPGLTSDMGRCVLELYRSAVQPYLSNLGQRLIAAELPPGLVFIANEDPYVGTADMCKAVASELGASTVALDGLGHWWMLDGASKAADALIDHWSTV